jgi:hypothetical protein
LGIVTGLIERTSTLASSVTLISEVFFSSSTLTLYFSLCPTRTSSKPKFITASLFFCPNSRFSSCTLDLFQIYYAATQSTVRHFQTPLTDLISPASNRWTSGWPLLSASELRRRPPISRSCCGLEPVALLPLYLDLVRCWNHCLADDWTWMAIILRILPSLSTHAFTLAAPFLFCHRPFQLILSADFGRTWILSQVVSRW